MADNRELAMESLEIDKSSTALVVIDLQKGIAAMPTQPHPSKIIVANAVKLAETFRARQMPVFLVHVGPSPDMKDALHPNCDQPMRFGERPPDWMEFIPELGPKDSDIIIHKRQWGSFYGTDLDLQLRRRGMKTIVLCGISTSIGVESTARFAFEYGYQQIFVEDACGASSKEEHENSVSRIFPRMGRIRNTQIILDALSG